MSERKTSKVLTVTGMLTVDELRKRIEEGEIDQVVMSFPDLYGRLLGKRFDGEFFLESGIKNGTHCSYSLMMCDMEMQVQPGYNYNDCRRRYGDCHLVPDMTSLRLMSWKDKTATVMCDIYDNQILELFAPRSVLRRQLDNASKLAYKVFSASELEYYTYENSYRDARALNYQQSKLTPAGDYAADYHLLQTAREEKYTSLFRRHLKASGIPIENSKGEFGIGQHELNIKFTDILSMADRHAVYKQCLKEIADQLGVSITFMAKPFTDALGSGCHLHLSMVNAADGTNAFVGDESIPGSDNVKCSALFRHFLAGWMKYTPDVMVFYAPTVNSYKRFVNSSFAPTRIAWSYDNRSAAFRVVGQGASLRIECRLAGADCNIYLAFAAALASGLQGLKEKLALAPICDGNIYEAQDLVEVPSTLKEAAEVFSASAFAREAFGDDVVNHYATFYRNEQAAYERSVSDWERHRYFEQI